jgi:hypothetical protein
MCRSVLLGHVDKPLFGASFCARRAWGGTPIPFAVPIPQTDWNRSAEKRAPREDCAGEREEIRHSSCRIP